MFITRVLNFVSRGFYSVQSADKPWELPGVLAWLYLTGNLPNWRSLVESRLNHRHNVSSDVQLAICCS